jgi:Flp pilus assembly protein TadB
MEGRSAVDREELKASIEARRELGAELEPQIVDSFVERIERRLAEARATKPARKDDSGHTLALAILSLLAAIPITGIAATHGGIVALVVVWAGIVLVNLAYARRP